MKRITTGFLMLASVTAGAQKPVPTMYLGPDLLIPALQINKAGSGGSTGALQVAPDGRILVFPKNFVGDIRFFDSLGKTLPVKTPIGDRDGDIGWWERSGWMGSTFWIGDMRFRQVALLDQHARVAKTIPNPSWVHPHWADRRKYPLFASLSVLAVYPDSTMLVRPQKPRTLLDTPGFNKQQTHLLRIDKDGAIVKDVAAFDDELNRLVLQGISRSEHVMTIPFFGQKFWQVSSDGKRIVFVTPGRTVADSGTFRVTALNENGDTVFTRTFASPAVRVNKKSVDSVLAAVKSFGDNSAEQIRAKLSKQIPEFQSFVTGLHAGIDHSTWIILRPLSDTAKARTALVLDERGEPIANVVMPELVQPSIVDRAHLWGVDRSKQSVVRLRVQSAPPPKA